MKKEKRSWIIVTDKKTYIFLFGILACIIFLIVDIINVFFLEAKNIIDFIADTFGCIIISTICVYLYVRSNSYSSFWNPDHPKPDNNIQDFDE